MISSEYRVYDASDVRRIPPTIRRAYAKQQAMMPVFMDPLASPSIVSTQCVFVLTRSSIACKTSLLDAMANRQLMSTSLSVKFREAFEFVQWLEHHVRYEYCGQFTDIANDPHQPNVQTHSMHIFYYKPEDEKNDSYSDFVLAKNSSAISAAPVSFEVPKPMPPRKHVKFKDALEAAKRFRL